MKARIYVTLKNGVLDPQGKAIENSLGHLGFDNINAVKQGKLFDVELGNCDQQEAEKMVDQMCAKLLANTVIENYEFEIVS